ncbi:MAG: prealbumin-like fold domain-containing protein [Bacillota bacterium]|jgi:LPXTG-motif cell wall-anchored protein
MTDINRKSENYLNEKRKKGHRRGVAALLVLLLVFATVSQLTLPALAQSGTAYCGMEEHQHSDACYEKVLVCGQDGVQGHTHSDACYETKLTCGREEHQHSLACFANDKADVETAAEWERTLPQTLSGNAASDLVAVAKSQVSYTESDENYVVESDGTTIRGWNRYGAKEGDAYKNWSASFVAFAVHYAGLDNVVPSNTVSTAQWMADLNASGQLQDRGYEAAAGDIVFLQSDSADHMGIVFNTGNDKIFVVEGDRNNAVRETFYYKSSEKILGYYALPKDAETTAAPVSEKVLTETIVPEAEAETENEPAKEETPERNLITETVVAEDVTDEATPEADAAASEEATAEEPAVEPEAELNGLREAASESVLFKQRLTFAGPDYTVTAYYDESADLPAGTELSVSEIAAGAAYEECLAQTKEALGTESDVRAARFFDISFVSEGKEVEPGAAVDVRISYEMTKAADSEVSVVHLPEGSEAEVLRPRAEAADSVYFKANSFSVYGVVEKATVAVDYLSADGATYSITVSYGPGAMIPSDAVLEVSEAAAEKDEYASYFDQVTAPLGGGAYVSSARLFDIKILVNGEEYEPKAPVNVKIEYKEPEALASVAEVSVLHFGKDNTEVLDAAVQESDGQLEGVVFTTDSFSVYAVLILGHTEETPDTEGTFECAGQGYKVTVTYTAAAQFPADTRMTIREIEADSDEYSQLLGEAWAKINVDYLLYKAKMKELAGTLSETDDTPLPDPVPLKNIDGVRFFDITFTYNGEEIEPCAPVQVQIDLDDGMQLYEHYGTEVVHFGSAGTEIINGVDARLDNNDSLVGVAYSQSSFSPIGIVSVGTAENDTVKEERTESRTFGDWLTSFSFKKLLSLFAPMTAYAAESDYVISGKAVNGTVKFYSDAACTEEITGAASGARVYIKATPDAGYYFSATTVTKVDGTPATDVTVERVDDEGNIYSFVMPGYDVLITGVFQPPPVAKKELSPNGDGTYDLSLSVKGTSADLSAAASTSKKVNVIVVMDRSTSMVRNTNNVEIYEEYEETVYPGANGPYYGLVNGEYIVLNRNNNAWTYQAPVLTEYTGTRYITSSDNDNDPQKYNNQGIKVYYHTNGGGHWSTSENHSNRESRYNGTRYVINTDATTETWGFVNGSMTSLTYSAEDGKYYRTAGTVAQNYNGTIYTLERVSRLRAEQKALDQMLGSLLEYNNPDIQGLGDVVEIEVISFASGRGDENNNTDINTLTQINSGSYYQYEGYGDTSSSTETGLLTSKTDLMATVNNNGTSSGTNWEEAMQYAKDEADRIHGLQPTEDVYILFLTDGEPTTHKGDYSAVGPEEYARELQYALDDAKTLVDAVYTYPADYEDESLSGEDTGKKNYLYGVFTYGTEGGSGQNYLKQFINFGYGYGTANNLKTDDAEGYLAKYFFDAKNNASLLSAMDTFIAAVFSSLAYGNVSITDGVTIGGTNSVTSSTLVSGTAGGFEYTVKGPNQGTLYTVTASGSDDDPTVTFHVNGADYPGRQKSSTIHITGDNPKTPDVVEEEFDQTLTYWYFDEVNYPHYKMCLAAVDDAGLVHWDLSGIGALQNNWTYTASFVVWPDQDAYDYAAGLNNNLGGDYTWDLDHQIDSGKGYYTNGTKYPYLVRYGAENSLEGSTFSVLTNYEQSMSYNVLSEVTTNGVAQYTYGATATVEMEPPEPMDLTGSEFSVTKNWNDSLDPSHLQALIKEAEAQGTAYGVTLDLYEDESLYKTYTFEPVLTYYADSDFTSKVEAENIEEGVTYYSRYEWPSQVINIAPALLVSELPDGSSADSYKTVTFNGKMYYVLNEGHEYYLEERPTDDFHFEFSADPYHPALIDGVMTNVQFELDENKTIKDKSAATQVGEVPLVTFAADNSLTAELDITKIIVDTNDSLTAEQEADETFTYAVTLTVPAGADASHIYGYEFVPRFSDTWNGNNRIYIYGYQGEEGVSTPFAEDAERFVDKVYGRWNSFVYSAFAGMDVNTERTVTVYMTMMKDGVIRFNNLPKGTRYSITEVAANVGTADDSNNYTTPITSFTVPENGTPEAQGYSVTSKSSKGTASGKTITGTITDLDTRYYNQFTNTLNDAAAVHVRVTKQLQGYTWGNNERYYVRLATDEGNMTLVRFTDLRRYLTNTAGSSDPQSYTYASSLRFSEAGTYTYYFDEMSNNTASADVVSGTVIGGIIYDSQKKLVITVGHVDEKLAITEIKDGDGNIVYSTDASAEITSGYVSYAEGVINTTITNRVAPLSIYKIGGSDTDTALSGVKFKLYSDADCAENHLVTQDSRGAAIGTNGVLETGDDGTVKIGVLNAGTYYLQETATKDGYNLLSEIVTVTIAEDGTISYLQESHSPSKQYNSKSDAAVLVKENGGLFITGTDDKGNAAGYTITVNNSAGVELPNTGGAGTKGFAVIGSVLLLGAGALLLRRRGKNA